MSYQRAKELAQTLNAARINAVTDPNNIDGPTVLVQPPRRTYNVGCGYTAEWVLVALVSGPGDSEAWQELDDITDEVVGLLDIETVTPTFYNNQPAYELRFSEVVPV